MTQHSPHRAHSANPLKRNLPLVRGVCWLGSFGVLSSGLAWAGPESGAETPLPPIGISSSPATPPPPTLKPLPPLPPTAPRGSADQLRAIPPVRNTPTRSPLVRPAPPQPPIVRPVEPTPPPVPAARPATSDASRSAAVPTLEDLPLFQVTPEASPPPPTLAAPPVPNATANGKNRYIDLNNYSTPEQAAQPGDRAPVVVELQERTTGCQTTLRDGQLVGGSCQATSPRRVAVPQPPSLPAPGGTLSDRSLPRVPVTATPGSRTASTVGLRPLSGLPALTNPPAPPPPPEPLKPREYVTRAIGRHFTNNGYVDRPRLQLPGNGNTALMYPLSIPARISSVFGWRTHPIFGDRRFHTGTDLAAPEGTPVVAAYDGKVIGASYVSGYGLMVTLRHHDDTHESRYAHLSEINVKPGAWVEQGTVVGRVGSTGNSTGAHLHFEWRIRRDSGWVAVDAGEYIDKGHPTEIVLEKPDAEIEEVAFADLAFSQELELALASPDGLSDVPRARGTWFSLPQMPWGRNLALQHGGQSLIEPYQSGQTVLFPLQLPQPIASLFDWRLEQLAEVPDTELNSAIASPPTDFPKAGLEGGRPGLPVFIGSDAPIASWYLADDDEYRLITLATFDALGNGESAGAIASNNIEYGTAPQLNFALQPWESARWSSASSAIAR